ncbi:RM28 protein, partial [Odontophorus gujanensis]|nr:RM28 protein [Odontophorus gujanensis]
MPLHKVAPRLWAKLRLRDGICARLPAHFLAQLDDDARPTPVHWRPLGVRYRRNPRTGERERVQDVPVPVHLPRAADEGLWGGEGWIRGFRYARGDKLSTRLPKIWKPQLFERQFYSEILDATLTVTVTMRTLDLIDQAYGFDFYILKARPRSGPRLPSEPPHRELHPLGSGGGWEDPLPCTPKVDMCSKLGMDLKRTMLLRLARRDPKLHPDDPARREAIYDKYREFVIPEEEAEWVGLSLEEAIEKQRLLEKKDPVPLFKVYAEELVNQLKQQALEKEKEKERNV